MECNNDSDLFCEFIAFRNFHFYILFKIEFNKILLLFAKLIEFVFVLGNINSIDHFYSYATTTAYNYICC